MIRAMAEHDLEMVLAWRNHPNVRHFMYHKQIISLEQHRVWYAKESVNPDRHLLIVEHDNTPFGFVNLHHIAHVDAVDWGFYIAPDASKGRGKLLAALTFDWVFSELKLHKICGQVLSDNPRSIKFHLNQGFEQEGVLKDQYLDDEEYKDIILFGLLKQQWQSKNHN